MVTALRLGVLAWLSADQPAEARRALHATIDLDVREVSRSLHKSAK